MQAIDRYAIDTVGIPSIILMESAALKILENIDLQNINSVSIICASGNNGGDGLAIARRLILANKEVDLFIIGNPDKGTKDFQINLTILKNMNIHFTVIDSEHSFDLLEHSLKQNDLTIDAIFGIGLNGEVKGLFYQVIGKINQHSNHILAVDIPSGLDGDSGELLGISVKANQTITFHQMKKGLIKNKLHAGEITVVNIGIPSFVTKIILEK